MRRPAVAVAAAVLVALAGQAPAVAPKRFAGQAWLDSPYVANVYAQLPGTRPWQNPQGQTAKDAQIQRAGLHWKYAWLAWSDVERTPGSYDWAMLDDFVTSAHDHEINLVLQVMVGAWGAPQPWAPPTRVNSRHPGTTPLPEDLAPLRDFWTTMVNRYKPDGVLAKAKGWGGYGVRVYEVENEPDQAPWWGAWSNVPLDFAQYLSVIHPAAHAAYKDVVVSAPALSQQEGANNGLTWLDRALTPGSAGSEWASDTYRASAKHPAAGPFIDSYSFHRDSSDSGDGSIPLLVDRLTATIAKHNRQQTDPTRANAPLYFSEGGPLQYASDYPKYAWSEAQLLAILLAHGVDRMTISFSTQQNEADFNATPLGKAISVFLRLFPRGGDVVEASKALQHKDGVAYVRTDPRTGLRTWIVWAKYLDTAGPSFVVKVPIRTSKAEVIGSDWSSKVVPVAGGAVPVTLHGDTPSPTVVVAERR